MHIKFLLAIFAQFITIIVVIIELNPNSLFWYLESLMIFNNFLSHISFYIFPQITLISHTSLINVLEILGFTLGNPFFFPVFIFFLPFYSYPNSTDYLRLSLYETFPLTSGNLQLAPTAITILHIQWLCVFWFIRGLFWLVV